MKSRQQVMTEEEYQHHRKIAKQVPGLGLCSRMADGRIKIEGYAPVPVDQLPVYHKKALEYI
jgi:hypothetical protein